MVEEITGSPAISIEAMRRGNGLAKVPNLGVVLNKLNIGKMWVKGELAKDAELVARERQQRKADKVEVDNISDRIEKLKGLGFTAQEAAELLQVERKKATKAVYVIKGLEGFGPGLGGLGAGLGGLGAGLAKAVKSFGSKRGS